MNEEERYDEICKPNFEELNKHQEEILKEIKDLKEKMFVGNGGKAWNVRIENVELLVKWITYALSTLALALLGRILYNMYTS